MNQATWNAMTESQRAQVRSFEYLNPQLTGLEGWRVEVDTDYGETRRFIVSRSTGWMPCHIEVSRRSSYGGLAAERHYAAVRKLYKAK